MNLHLPNPNRASMSLPCTISKTEQDLHRKYPVLASHTFSRIWRSRWDQPIYSRAF